MEGWLLFQKMTVQTESSLTDCEQMAAADLSVRRTMEAEICFGGCFFCDGANFYIPCFDLHQSRKCSQHIITK